MGGNDGEREACYGGKWWWEGGLLWIGQMVVGGRLVMDRANGGEAGMVWGQMVVGGLVWGK